jgi:hypothetical protein
MAENDSVDVSDKVVVNVDPGACRLHSQIIGWIDDDGKLKAHITSDCKYVVEFGKHLHPMDVMEVLRMPYCENTIYIEAGMTLKHSTCAVPLALLKCLEATGGMAVKRDVLLTFQPAIQR